MLARLSAGLIIWVATSRARVRYSGVRIKRRFATSVSSVVSEKRRPEPTFFRSTIRVGDRNGRLD